jgi:type IV secretory pathway protease TraF
MRRFVAGHRKALAIAVLGALELAAYIIADPAELPDWVVTAATVANVLGVYFTPRNAQPVSREDLQRKVDYLARPPRRHVRREDRDP